MVKDMAVFTVLWVAAMLQLCNCILEGNDNFYTTRFMVEVEGGRRAAETLAHTLGVKNLGPVSVKRFRRSEFFITIVTQVGGLKNVFLLGMEESKRRLTVEELTTWAEINTTLHNDESVSEY